MELEAYRHRIFLQTMEYPTRYGKGNIIAIFENLGRWGTKYRLTDQYLVQEGQHRFRKRLYESLESLLKLSQSQIHSYNTSMTKYLSSIHCYIRIFSGTGNYGSRRAAFDDFEKSICGILYNYFIFNFMAQVALIALDNNWKKSSEKESEICFNDPFEERVYAYFNTSTVADRRIVYCKDMYMLLRKEYPEAISLIVQYLKESKSIYTVFNEVWTNILPKTAKNVSPNLTRKINPKAHISEFMEAVNRQYPIVDASTKHTEEGHPLVVYDTYKRMDDRVDMLLEILREKGNDPNLAPYIRELLGSYRKYNLSIKNSNGVNIDYLQLLYERIIDMDSIKDMETFDRCFSIRESIKEPWSPLFNFYEIKDQFIEYCISVGVDLNAEKSILGREIAMTKHFVPMHNCDTQLEFLKFLIDAGMEIIDPGFYFMIAVENSDSDLLSLISDYASIDVDSDFALRVALFEENLSFAYQIMHYYESDATVYERIEKLLKIDGIPRSTKHTAEKIMKEKRIMDE